jgi:hypothetical protein
MARKPPLPVLKQWALRLAGTVFLGLAACGKPVPADVLVCGHPKQPREVQSGQVRNLWQCGPTLDFTPVNSYQGEFSDVLEGEEDAVVLIDGRCTGTLVAASAGPVVVTAGHCVGLGDQVVISFNFEEAPDGEELNTGGTVIEQALEPDYALIRLDALPAVTPVLLTSRPSARLAIIQHPRGHPKVIAEGWYEDSCDSLVYYSDLDTLVGSSGAGVLTRQGHLLGIHTDGDCEEDGRGTNQGWSAQLIVEASAYLQPEDIADR